MSDTGWEIQPAGWLFLFIVGILLIYFLHRWLQDSSRKNPGII